MRQWIILSLFMMGFATLQAEANKTEEEPACTIQIIDPVDGRTPDLTSIAKPCGCGPTIPTTGTFLYTYNNIETSTKYPTGTDIPFNGPTLIGGTAISHPTDETFVINRAGSYLVTFVGSTFASEASSVNDLITDEFTAQVQFFLNGSPVSAAIEGTILGTMIVNNAIISVPTAPSILTARVVNATLWLNEDNSATLTIVRISPAAP